MAISATEATERSKLSYNLRFKGIKEVENEDVHVTVASLLKELGQAFPESVAKKIGETGVRLGNPNPSPDRRARDIRVIFNNLKFRTKALELREQAREKGWVIAEDLTRAQMDEVHKARDVEVRARWERTLLLFAPWLSYKSYEDDKEEIWDHVASVIYDGLGYTESQFSVEDSIESVERLRPRERGPVFGKPSPVKVVFTSKRIRDEVFNWRAELQGTYYRLEEPRPPRSRGIRQ